MIIRKPYAFLIKNFKKIHVALLLLSLFVVYKLFDVNSYVSEFMRLGTYDMFGDPISKHITFWLRFSIFLLIVGTGFILFLLRHKKKPWKVYLIPIIEYAALFLVLSMIASFFSGYSSSVSTKDLRLSRDLLLIFLIGQVPTIFIYIMRVFGLDMNKFQFNFDQEFLELDEKDREEVEIGIDIDKHSIIRWFKKTHRYLTYFYLEHKKICISILVFVGVIFCFNLYHFIFVTHKSYKIGDFYNVNGYVFKINHVYYTDKDYNGQVISADSNFIIVDLTIENRSAPRTVYLENFHLKNGTDDYVTTNKLYAKEFQDLGVVYESSKKLQRDEILNCIIVYKVDNSLKKNRFVLFYQENSETLRKIKLKIDDISTLEDIVELNLEEELPLTFNKNADTLRIDYAEVTDWIDYTVRNCSNSICVFDKKRLYADSTYRILSLEFSSEVYEAKNIIDFLNNYGKLKYRDSNDEEYVIKFDNALKEAYYGKTIFLKVPVEFETAKEIYLEFVIRDKQYVYRILGGANEENIEES